MAASSTRPGRIQRNGEVGSVPSSASKLAMISPTSPTSAIVASVGATARCHSDAPIGRLRKKPTTAAEVPAISSTTPTAAVPDIHVNICSTGSAPNRANTATTTTASPLWASEPAMGPPERAPTRLSAVGSTRSRPSANR